MAPLEASGLDWRIGVTTTDNGNPWCSGTTPEGGALRASSCFDRQDDFIFYGAVTVDATQEACLDFCTISNIAPSKPWLQRVGGDLDVDIDPADALACMLPQGVSGCGFEQPLEMMYKAVERSLDDTEAQYGFIPEGARLAVVVVTDEADCSYNPEQETIFLPDGDRTFWSVTNDGVPTSAVCWNAGVSCSGGDCHPINLDPLGNATDPDHAVMRPVSRYVDQLAGAPDAYFAAIVGVAADGSVTYAGTADQAFQDQYGIGPGCVSANGDGAVPPVRVRTVAGASNPPDQRLFSICAPDFSPAMQAIAEAIVASVSG